MKTLMQLVSANFKEMMRDRMALFWFLAFPVLFILLFGAIFSNQNDQASFQVGLVREDQGPVGGELEKVFKAVPIFKISVDGREAELDALARGRRSVVVVLPEGLSSSLVSAQKSAVKVPVYYDATKMTSNQIVLPAIRQILDETERQATNQQRLFEVKPEPIQSDQMKTIDFLLPGVLAMALMQLGLFGSLRLVSLRERKILKRLGATPLPRSLLMVSEVMVRLFMAVVQAFTVVIIGHLVFGVNIISSWLYVLGLVLIGASVFVSLGYMLVSFVKTEESGQGIIQLVQFPMMFLSGIFFPINVLPSFLQPVVKAMPLTYLADALRQVMTGASPEYALSVDLTVLAAWLVVTLGLGIRFFQWE